ncbi:putative small s protein [Neofusicoccum parvum UCRNP2]|uniref:Putative small s protein n=1 Tax=Botryosphaeria parva (strain UCR-NP2) TaxID=1287680 RepID=R1EAS6_BOTPV|nr:putative small s protein [Neofusicoccum parvum UCRNP2]
MGDVLSATTTALDLALTCFERVQIARSFDQDLNSHRIKLDIIQVRLSRWGEAVGLYGSSNSSNSTALAKAGDGTEQAGPLLTEAEYKTAQGLLEAIEHQFDFAQQETASMLQQQPQRQDDGGVIDPARDLSSLARTVRDKLRATLRRRCEEVVKVAHSVQWAFYKKEKFDEFVTELSDTIGKLEALFPAEKQDAAVTRLRELGAAECAGIEKVYLKVLSAVSKDCDPVLDAAVDDALRPREAAAGKNIYMSNDGVNNGQQIGEMSGTQKGFSFGTTNNFGKGATNHWGSSN